MSLPWHRVPRHDVEPRPVIGVLCCNERFDRPIQSVASRFIEPLHRLSDVTVLLVPAITDAVDIASVAARLDGLLLTGSRSHVAPARYGINSDACAERLDVQRDEVAMRLAARMIETARPVFGICRGLQELNVLFGGSLHLDLGEGRHHGVERDGAFEALFDHAHSVDLADGGVLAGLTGQRRLTVNSVHRQGIDRLGEGLAIEATDPEDGLIEAFHARPCGAEVLAVQWHPEWQADAPESARLFQRMGASLRREL